jgi:sugar phosphate isomerase/epimerase
MQRFTLLFLLLSVFTSFTFGQKGQGKPSVGIVESMENDEILFSSGYCCRIESISKYISPKSTNDGKYAAYLESIKKLKIPIYAYNLFLPGDLKVVGPDVNENALLEYVDIVFYRISQTDTKLVVWGSGGSRMLPSGFDKKLAKKQFISIAKKISLLAKKYGIMLALENLNSSETNFITTAKEALHIVKKVDHSNFKLNVDLYHMLKENESPEIIKKTRNYIVHVEIAEKENRTAPGVDGTDFRAYLQELKSIGYQNKIVIEGRWKNISDIAEMSINFIQNQINEVYK